MIVGFVCVAVVDQFTRECLLLYADRALSGEKVAAELERVVRERGVPTSITVDNGSEFASRAMDAWAYGHGIGIRPGKPVLEYESVLLARRCATETGTVARRLRPGQTAQLTQRPSAASVCRSLAAIHLPRGFVA